jgi:hypothetical protein
MMVLMKEHYHTYQHEDRTAEVWKTINGHWATRYYDKRGGKASVWVEDVVHKGKSERWAEDAAENWVFKVNS